MWNARRTEAPEDEEVSTALQTAAPALIDILRSLLENQQGEDMKHHLVIVRSAKGDIYTKHTTVSKKAEDEDLRDQNERILGFIPIDVDYPALQALVSIMELEYVGPLDVNSVHEFLAAIYMAGRGSR